MIQNLPPIPGLGEATSTATLMDALRTSAQRPLEFHLDGRLLIGPGYHVTEVKAVSIEAMDCGGQAASWRETVIQLMDGSAEDAASGFMTNRKFLAIYDRGHREDSRTGRGGGAIRIRQCPVSGAAISCDSSGSAA